MASLSYDYRWNPINTNFNDANSMFAQGAGQISKVGDIFSKFADRIAAREAKQAELDLRRLGLDLDREKMGIERDKLGQAWNIAMLEDVREREKAAYQREKDSIAERQNKLDAEAMLSALARQKERAAALPGEIKKTDEEFNKIFGPYDENRLQLSELDKRLAESSSDLEKISRINPTRQDRHMAGDWWSGLINGSSSNKLPPELSAAQNEYASNLAQREVLNAIMQSPQYIESEKEAAEKAQEVYRRRQKLGVEEATLYTPDYLVDALLEERAKRGVDITRKTPFALETPFEAAYALRSGLFGNKRKSSKSNKDKQDQSNENILAALDTAPAKIAKEIGFDWIGTDETGRQIIIDIANNLRKTGVSPKVAMAEAMSRYKEKGVPTLIRDLYRSIGNFRSVQDDIDYGN